MDGYKLSLQDVREVIKNKGFLKLWLAQIAGQIGINSLHFFLIIQIFVKSGNNFLVGVLIAVLSLPSIFLSPLGGVFSDSFNRKVLLFYINIVRMILVICILFFVSYPGLLLVFAFLITSASQIFVPTEQASIPDLVDKKYIMTANSLFSFSIYMSFLLGYVGAGPLLEYTNELVTLIVVAVLFLIAAVLEQMLPDLDDHIDQTLTVKQRLHIKSILKSLVEGVKYIYNFRTLSVIVTLVAFIFAVERSVIALVPDLLQNIMGFNIAEISFFAITPLAIGTVIGVLLVNYIKHKHHPLKIICIGLFLDAAVLFILSLVKYMGVFLSQEIGADTALWFRTLVSILAFISGLADVLIIVSSQTFVHFKVESATRGRVFAGFYTLMNAISIPLVLLISFFSDVLNTLFVLFIFGVFAILGSVWGFVNYTKIKKSELSEKAI